MSRLVVPPINCIMYPRSPELSFWSPCTCIRVKRKSEERKNGENEEKGAVKKRNFQSSSNNGRSVARGGA